VQVAFQCAQRGAVQCRVSQKECVCGAGRQERGAVRHCLLLSRGAECKRHVLLRGRWREAPKRKMSCSQRRAEKRCKKGEEREKRCKPQEGVEVREVVWQRGEIACASS